MARARQMHQNVVRTQRTGVEGYQVRYQPQVKGSPTSASAEPLSFHAAGGLVS